MFLSNQITCTEHNMSLYPSTGDPSQSISHYYTSTHTGIVMTPYLETTSLSGVEISTALKLVNAHYMTSAMNPIPTSSSFKSAMSSVSNGTSLEPMVRLTCYSCSGTGCGQERQQYDPLRQCAAGEFCYFEIIIDGMMSVYTRGCVRAGDVTCQKASDKFSCRQSRRDMICRLCCQYNKCNSMAWIPPNTTTSLTSGIATVIVVIIVTLM
ncbi:uncharacterized protein LOC110456843 [Mizuhopecten yessoensis]|uniref:uncharacterized protein LOC110456843 n=1 Tax=Mizuhopecten yessoensis TaxID=6573 RepID=UPI000B45B06E|nr:uncharacterized protein LOC110456843 [Mizuhopecten yessoensis]